MILSAATSQPSVWTPEGVVLILTCVALVLIPALITLITIVFKNIKELRTLALASATTAAEARGASEQQAKSIDRLSARANVQDEKIHQVVAATDPERLSAVSRPAPPDQPK